MDLARRVYGRELKVAAMREIDSGRTMSEVARQLELSPKLLERWRSEWRARGELAFPGNGRRGVSPACSQQQRPFDLVLGHPAAVSASLASIIGNSVQLPWAEAGSHWTAWLAALAIDWLRAARQKAVGERLG